MYNIMNKYLFTISFGCIGFLCINCGDDNVM